MVKQKPIYDPEVNKSLYTILDEDDRVIYESDSYRKIKFRKSILTLSGKKIKILTRS